MKNHWLKVNEERKFLDSMFVEIVSSFGFSVENEDAIDEAIEMLVDSTCDEETIQILVNSTCYMEIT